ncbi:hypothetical protein [Rhodococcus jostii]
MGVGKVHETLVDYDALDYRRVSGARAFEADAQHVGMSEEVTR